MKSQNMESINSSSFEVDIESLGRDSDLDWKVIESAIAVLEQYRVESGGNIEDFMVEVTNDLRTVSQIAEDRAKYGE